MKLANIERLLKQYPGFEEFRKLHIVVMKANKKPRYWGTSVRRFLEADGKRVSDVEGTIYINFRDTEDRGKTLKVIAHEAAHLLGNERVTMPKILEYLEKEVK